MVVVLVGPGSRVLRVIVRYVSLADRGASSPNNRQDTVSAKGLVPYDFMLGSSVHDIARAENFIFGTQIGDLAFFGYSGAHEWSETVSHATSFCSFVGGTLSVQTVVILGHWNAVNDGCKAGMDVPSVHEKMKRMDGCKEKRLLYFMGHEHCNMVTNYTTGPLDAIGFMIGGTGMIGNDCSQFGFTVLQSDPQAFGGPNVRVDHFPIAEATRVEAGFGSIVDSFDETMQCLREHGYSACRKQHGVSFRATDQNTISIPHKAFAERTQSTKDQLTTTLTIHFGNALFHF